MRATGGNVFVRREKQIDSLHGMFVSDNAAIKNPIGKVVAVDGNCVGIGDEVLMRNFQVYDIKVDGEELAYCKA